MIARPRLFGSLVFRLALGYTMVFMSATAALFGLAYVIADRLMARETDAAIQGEITSMLDQFVRDQRAEGIYALLTLRGQRAGDGIYLLYDSKGGPAIGNLEAPPEFPAGEAGWINFHIKSFNMKTGALSDEEPRPIRAQIQPLNTRLSLLVGRDISVQEKVKGVFRRMMLGGAALTLLMGLAGGAFAGRRMLARVENARRAAQEIMTGDLSRRLPLAGGDDELERLSTTLNEMLDRIERLVSAMGEVTDDVAHDLRTPLTRLRSRAEGALSDAAASPAELRAALEDCVGEADRLLAIFKAILSIARLEASAGGTGYPEIDLSEAVADAAELYEPVLEEAGFALKLNVAPGVRLKAERALIGQAIANLIENALKYGAPPEGSGRAAEITLALADRFDHVEISVADRGPGVPEDKREAAFARFARLDPSRAAEGVGLGLAFVRAVAETHGGTARMEEAAPGARVILRLPKRFEKP